ncbi:hypothetical protein B1812_14745 [Methylocystis bryophila]|uniref:Uncharacterized protein n=1 Tax=Methylocystis bryophila TaxID=655015 RepID=A0A1W6MX26_9HYPH|nr:hypothetical protein B1812_14745 [Methylocystis bryophila]
MFSAEARKPNWPSSPAAARNRQEAALVFTRLPLIRLSAKLTSFTFASSALDFDAEDRAPATLLAALIFAAPPARTDAACRQLLGAGRSRGEA